MSKQALHFLVGILCIVGAAVLFYVGYNGRNETSNHWLVVVGCLVGAYNFILAVKAES